MPVVPGGEVDLRARLDEPPRVPFRHIPALDGTRGIGIAIVMFGHYSAGLSDWAKTRFFGVSLTIDLFFVLSGFLITTLLLEEWSKTNHISMRNFYVRRGLRLLPALAALLAFVVLVVIFTDWLPTKLTLAEVAAAALYVYPVILVAKGEQAFLVHLWTLSVEEWFYFLWPGFLLLVGLRPGSSQRLKLVIGSLVAFCLACLLVRASGRDDGLSKLVAALRPDSLFYGSLLAFLRRWMLEFPKPRLDRLLRIVGPLGFVGYLYFAWLATYPRPESAVTEEEFHALAFRSWNYQLGILCCVLMVAHMVHQPQGRISSFLSLRPLTYLGLLSYAIYLWHQPLFLLANRQFFHGDPAYLREGREYVEHTNAELWAFGIGVGILSILVAIASRHFIELPALRMKKRFEVVHYEDKR